MVVPGSRRAGVKRRFCAVEQDEEEDLFAQCDQDEAPPSPKRVKLEREEAFEEEDSFDEEDMDMGMGVDVNGEPSTTTATTTTVPTTTVKQPQVAVPSWVPKDIRELCGKIMLQTDDRGRLLPTSTITEADYVTLLEKTFHYQEFRKGQLECIKRIISGHGALCILPTGMGKSLCYQYCTLWFRIATGSRPSICIVVSPLIALMADQVRNLPKILNGGMMSANTSPDAMARLIHKVKTGGVQVLFTSPERVANSESFSKIIAEIRLNISFVCIDEAHCLSEWSHNFRPCYLRLKSSFLDKHKIDTVMCLTGTSTTPTTSHIQELLSLTNDDVIRCSDHRENLSLSSVVIESKLLDERDRENEWLQKVFAVMTSPPLDVGSVVVYVNTQKQSELITEYLVQRGVSAISYHAEASERQSRQNKFISGEVRVIVATVAFGMGIDKPDVRGVVHLRFPPSLESYIQEIGRAGRDGENSHCVAVVKSDDYFASRSAIFRNMISKQTCRYLLEDILEATDPTRLGEDLEKSTSGTVTHHAELDRLSKATSALPEVVETICTMLAAKHPEVIEVRGQQFTNCVISFGNSNDEDEKKADEGVGHSGLTLVGDNWVETDPVLQYIKGLRNATRREVSVGRRGCRVTVDLVKASRAVGVSYEVVIERIEAYKKRYKWRVRMKDNAIVCGLKRVVTMDQVATLTEDIYSTLGKIRESETAKLNVCHGFLKRLSSAPKTYPAHKVLSTYTTEDPTTPFSIATSHAAHPPPPAYTRNIVAHTAVTDAVRDDPAALSDPLYVAKLCYGILPPLAAIPDHKLWNAYADHDFYWLMAQAEDAVSGL